MAGGVIGFVGKLIVEVFISYAINAVTNKLFGKKSNSPTYSIGTLQTQTNSDSVMPIIYGKKVKCAGNNLWQSKSGTTVQRLVGFGLGKNQGVSNVRLDDIPIVVQTYMTIAYMGSESYGHFKYSNTDLVFYLIMSSGTLSFNCDSATSLQLVTWINAQTGWEATSEESFTISSDIPNNSETDCTNATISITGGGLSGCSYAAYMGDGVQTIDSRVTGDAQEDKAKLVGGMKYDAYLALTITGSDSISSNPNITAVWEGRIVKIWDTLTVYHEDCSDNVWCVLDFMTSVDGCNIPIDKIDIQSFITAAAYAQPADGSRYWSINLILDEKKSRQDWLNDMLLCFRAWRTYQNGKHGILIDKPEPVSQIFIVKKTETVQIDWQELSEDVERIILKYRDPDYEWQNVGAPATMKAPFRNATYNTNGTVLSNGTPLTKTVEVNGITNFKQASQHSWFYLNQAQTCGQKITYTCNKRALNRTIGDVVGIYDPITEVTEPGLAYKRYRILSMTEPQGISIQLYCMEYNEALYGDTQGSVAPTVNVTKLPNPAQAPPFVTNLYTEEHFRSQGDGTVLNDLLVSFTPPNDMFFSFADAYIKTDQPAGDELNVPGDQLDVAGDKIGDAIDVWKYVGSATNGNILIQNLVKGQEYSVKLVSVSKMGLKSDFDTSPVIKHVIQGKTYTPQTPSGLNVNITSQCDWTWNPLADDDTDFAELRTDQNPGNPTGLMAKTLSTKATVTPPTRSGTAYLYAHNTADKYSSPCIYRYNKPAPSAPTNVNFTDIFQGLVITCDPLPVYCLGINVHTNDGTGDKVYFSPKNNSYNFKSTGGIYDIQVAYVDLFGEGAKSAVVEKVIKETIDPALLSAELQSLQAMQPVIVDAVAKADAAATKISVDQVTADLNSAKTQLSTVQGTVTTQSASITTLNNEIALTATSSTVDAVKSRVTIAEGSIVTQAGQISAKAAQTTVDTLASTVSSNYSSLNLSVSGITQTASSNKATQDGVNSGLVAQIDVQAGQITQVASNLNGAYTAIAQNTTDIQARVTTSNFNGSNIVAQLNLGAGGVRIDGVLFHVTAQTWIDNNVIVSGMIQAGAVTADKIVVGVSLTSPTITGGTVIGGRIQNAANTAYIDANGNIHGVNITGANITGTTIDATTILSAGYQIKTCAILFGTITDQATIPLPSGYLQSQCAFGVTPVYGSYSDALDGSGGMCTADLTNRVVHTNYVLNSGQTAAAYWVIGVK